MCFNEMSYMLPGPVYSTHSGEPMRMYVHASDSWIRTNERCIYTIGTYVCYYILIKGRQKWRAGNLNCHLKMRVNRIGTESLPCNKFLN